MPEEETLFGWFTKLYRIEEYEILEKCGEEVVFYLKYEKYCAGLFFFMSILNIPALCIYYQESHKTSQEFQEQQLQDWLLRLTVLPLIELATKGESGTPSPVVLILFLSHLLLQHLQIVMYRQEITSWKNQTEMEAHDKSQQNKVKKIQENTLVMTGIQQGDDPKKISKFINQRINELMNSLEDPKYREEVLEKRYKKADIEELRGIPAAIKQGEEAIKRWRELVGLKKENGNFMEPVYSFHCPGDYNQITSLIDEFEDNKIMN